MPHLKKIQSILK